ncbi:MAG: hypothetical protein ACRD02_01805 [Acidimicrobiia bacterium]
MRVGRLEQIVGRIEAEGERRDRMAQWEAPPLLLDELTHEERAEVISLARDWASR